MAKKKKSRPNVPQQTLARARAELYGEELPEAEEKKEDDAAAKKKKRESTQPEIKRREPEAPPAVSVDDLREEYEYVIRDLRSMAILAVLLFASLIVVALIIV